jgi:hypothetical protein
MAIECPHLNGDGTCGFVRQTNKEVVAESGDSRLVKVTWNFPSMVSRINQNARPPVGYCGAVDDTEAQSECSGYSK